MSMEQRVREWHALQDRVNGFAAEIRLFREKARLMDVRSLELAIAQLIDHIDKSQEDAKRLDFRFKVMLLQPIYEVVRNTPPKKDGFLAGMFGPTPPYPYQMVLWQMPYPFPLTEPAINEWAGCEPLDPSRLLPPPPSAGN